MKTTMTIGEVANLSGLSVKMIRRYEEAGIIPKAKRSSAGYRLYRESDAHALAFVKRARELGFSMKDIKELLGLWSNKKRSSGNVKKIAAKHQQSLRRKLEEIKSVLMTLDSLVDRCHGDERPDCPILEDLAGPKDISS